MPAVWLVWAVRSHQRSHFASAIFGLTAAVILPPLLWEGTVRFHELPVSFTSAVLAGAVLLCLGLAWKERLEAIPWIGTLVAVMTVFALIIATHELRPLTTTLLALALVTEAVAASGRWPGLRVVTAVAADYAVGLVGVVMTSEDGVPESYRAMGAAELNAYCAALMIIYGASIGTRAFVMRRRLTLSEVVQAAVAFLLGTWVSLRATHGGSASVLGAVFLLLAMVCYWGTLKRFAGAEERRNRRVCANFAAGLVLAASLLLLKGNLQALALSVAAVAAVAVFTRTRYLSLGIHGTFYPIGCGNGMWTVLLHSQRACGEGTGLAGVEFLGCFVGWVAELCAGITIIGRRMARADAVGGACGGGGECCGSVDRRRDCGAGRRGIERVEIVDGAHGGNVRDRTGIGIRRIAMEPGGTGLGGVRSDRIRSAKTDRRRFALWKRGNTDGVAPVLWTHTDFAAAGDAVWKDRSMRVLRGVRFLWMKKDEG